MKKSNYQWEFYQDIAKKWRWRKVSTSNGKIVGASSESFSSKQNALYNAKIMGYEDNV